MTVITIKNLHESRAGSTQWRLIKLNTDFTRCARVAQQRD